MRCWGMCGAGMPHLLCAFPGWGYYPAGVQGYAPAGVQGYAPAGVQGYAPAGAQGYNPAGVQGFRPYPKVPSSSSLPSPPGVTVPLP